MSAVIAPFPLARRRDFVVRQAHRSAEMNPAAGERYIQRQIQVQRETMERRGIAPEAIDAELKALEAAIRAALWQIVMRVPGGGI